MKELALMRHAHARPPTTGEADFARALSGRGEVDAAAVGRRVAPAWRGPDLVIASPARRALRTAQIVAAALAYPPADIRFDPRLYEGRVGDLAAVLQALEPEVDRVVLVAHNPAITGLAIWLLQEWMQEMPAGSCMQLALAIDEWRDLAPGCARLRALDQPLRAD
jgi:phosphohistidine phosphatase